MTRAPLDLRERMVRAAARLLKEGGREAVSTRSVSAAAGVQAPAIYRQFGDMHGLLLASARAIFAEYVRTKVREAPVADPVEGLRRGWDLHVAFGLANPAAFALLYADPVAAAGVEVLEGQAHLTTLVTRVAEAGRLRVSIPLAVKMIHAAGCGVTLTLITTSAEARDPKVSSVMRDTVLAALVVGKKARADGAGDIAARAVALRAVLPDAENVLSPGETRLMEEWLDRMADGNYRPSEAEAPQRPARSVR